MLDDNDTPSQANNSAFRKKAGDVEDGIESDSKGCIQRRMVTVAASMKTKAKKTFSRKTLENRLPFLVWLPKYRTEHLVGDLVAGLTIGLMIIPQGLAYGFVAGLPPTYGLYSSFVGGIVYAFLGTTPELAMGPTAILAILTKRYAAQGGTDYAVLLCFTSGIIEVIAGMANLGFLITYISQPVISGFTSAAALTIFSSQLRGLLGLKVKSRGVIDTWIKICQNISLTRWQDLTLGISCICVITFLKQIRSLQWKCLGAGKGTKSLYHQVVAKVVFFFSVSRNAAVVLVSACIAYALRGENQPFTLTGYVTPGIPPAQFPPTTAKVGNETLPFSSIMTDVGLGVVMIPFLGILYNIAIVTAFAKGRSFDAKQEIIALGVSNIVGSFFRSMPTAGAMSRAAVSSSSGVKTPAGGLVTGAIVLLTLGFLTPAISYIPKTTLAAVILCAVASMVDYEILKPLWKTRRLDLIPLGVTFFISLLWGLEWGILLGVGVNIAFLLFSLAKPEILVTKVNAESSNGGIAHVLIRPSQGGRFLSCDHLRKELQRAGVIEAKSTLPVVVDCTGILDADFTTAKVVKNLMEEYKKRAQPLIFMNFQRPVEKILRSLSPNLCVCSSSNNLSEVLMESFGSLPTTSDADKNAASQLKDEEPSNSSKGYNLIPLSGSEKKASP